MRNEKYFALFFLFVNRKKHLILCVLGSIIEEEWWKVVRITIKVVRSGG